MENFLGKHSLNGHDSQRMMLAGLALEIAENPPKPGSRRARREAERAAARAVAQTAVAQPVAQMEKAKFPSQIAKLSQNTSTATTQNQSESLPNNHLAQVPSVKVKTTEVFAEYMNEQLVAAQAMKTEIKTRVGLFKNARATVIALVAATSVFSVVIGANSFQGSTVPAYAASTTPPLNNANAQVIEKISYTVTADGDTGKYAAISGVTIAQALKNAGIKLTAQDEVSLPLNNRLADGDKIKIARIKQEYLTEEFVDKFTNIDETDTTLPKGEKKVVTPGVDGKGVRTFVVKYRDGQEINREVIAEALSVARVDQITKVGAKEKNKENEDFAVPPAGPVPSPGSARAIAQQMLGNYGWNENQFSCLDRLWQRESGWNAAAMNRSSGAYGIPQSLPASKMASAGADWRTNPATQIRWGLGYIQGRYGSPCGAWGHSQARGWY